MNNNQSISIVILIICLILGLYFIVPKVNAAIATYTEVKAKTQAVEDSKKQIEDLKNTRTNYEKEEKVATKPVYKNDVETTDQMSSFGVMFEDVIQSAKYNGLKLRSVSYNEMPQQDLVAKNISSDYNVCEITMELIGSYMQFRSYFQDIYNYPYLINLDKINIKPYENNKRILLAEVTIVLYSTKNDIQKAAAAAASQETTTDQLIDAPGAGAAPQPAGAQ